MSLIHGVTMDHVKVKHMGSHSIVPELYVEQGFPDHQGAQGDRAGDWAGARPGQLWRELGQKSPWPCVHSTCRERTCAVEEGGV